MEYREDLFVTLLAGLPRTERTAVMESIDHATDVKRRQIRRSALSEEQRLRLRRDEKLANRQKEQRAADA
jgi:uncharacterized protein YaiL (DUF2058 family)